MSTGGKITDNRKGIQGERNKESREKDDQLKVKSIGGKMTNK
jgi:hypothetical protein